MFDAMHDGDLGVQFIPHNSREATLILTNNTDQPLNVHLPEAFAAIPVVAQFPQQQPAVAPPAPATSAAAKGSKIKASGSGTNPNQRPNGFGGAVANGKAGAQAGNGGNGAAFSIPPERVVKLKLSAVCLEYGNAEPNAHVPYTIVPIDTYTSSAEVRELCRQLGTGKLDQQVAQAAAWHLTSHMSWDKITEMKQFAHNSGFSHAVFSKDQIRAAQELTDKVIKIVEAQPAATPSTEQKPAASTPAATSTATPGDHVGIVDFEGGWSELRADAVFVVAMRVYCPRRK